LDINGLLRTFAALFKAQPDVFSSLRARFERCGPTHQKTLKPTPRLTAEKKQLCTFFFLTAVHHASATVIQACPTLTPKSAIVADVITGLFTLGFGIFILRVPPERMKPTRR
jgi:hypothetical protein